MEERKVTKISLSTFFLLLAIIVIVIMGYFVYKFYNEKIIESEKVSNLNNQIANLENEQKNTNKTEEPQENENVITESENNKNAYIKNFSESVSKELGGDNNIYIALSGFDNNKGTGELLINNKNEAYIHLSTFQEYSSGNMKKIADNVVNAWHCSQGQVPGNSYIIFLKEDGTVTYVRFKTDSSTGGNTTFESEEKVLNGITDISNIITINGNGANGIGGVGVLFIKTDGTCLSYSTLDDLAKK